MRTVLVLLLLIACKKPATESVAPVAGPIVPPDGAPVSSPVPAVEPGLDALHTALSVRDPEPTCESLEAVSDDLSADLATIADETEMPPWAPMRAARCLLQHHIRGNEGLLTEWMADPDKAGLAQLVVQRIDDLPGPLAERLASEAMTGPNASTLRDGLLKASNPRVRELAETTP